MMSPWPENKLHLPLLLAIGCLLGACANPLGDTALSSISAEFGPKDQPRSAQPQTNTEPVVAHYKGPSDSNRYLVELTIGSNVAAIQVQSTHEKTVYLNFQGQEVSK
jgi:hypothetical protein